jgi:hypothetical protein
VRAPFAGIVNYVVGTPPAVEGQPLAMVSRISAEQHRTELADAEAVDCAP